MLQSKAFVYFLLWELLDAEDFLVFGDVFFPSSQLDAMLNKSIR